MIVTSSLKIINSRSSESYSGLIDSDLNIDCRCIDFFNAYYSVNSKISGFAKCVFGAYFEVVFRPLSCWTFGWFLEEQDGFYDKIPCKIKTSEFEKPAFIEFFDSVPEKEKEAIRKQSQDILQLIPFKTEEFINLFNQISNEDKLDVLTTVAVFFSQVLPQTSFDSKNCWGIAQLEFKLKRDLSAKSFTESYQFLIIEILAKIGSIERSLFRDHAELLVRTFFNSEKFGPAKGRSDLFLLRELLQTPLPSSHDRLEILLLIIRLFCEGYTGNTVPWGPAGVSYYENVLLQAIHSLVRIPSKEGRNQFYKELRKFDCMLKLNLDRPKTEAFLLLQTWPDIPSDSYDEVCKLAGCLWYDDDEKNSASSYCQIISLFSHANPLYWNQALKTTLMVMNKLEKSQGNLEESLAVLAPRILHLTLNEAQFSDIQTIAEFEECAIRLLDSEKAVKEASVDTLWAAISILWASNQANQNQVSFPLLSLLTHSIQSLSDKEGIQTLGWVYKMRSFAKFPLQEIILSAQKAASVLEGYLETEKEELLLKVRFLLPEMSQMYIYPRMKFVESLAAISDSKKRDRIILIAQLLLDKTQNDKKISLIQNYVTSDEQMVLNQHLAEGSLSLACQLISALSKITLAESMECLTLAAEFSGKYKFEQVFYENGHVILAILTKLIAEIPKPLRSIVLPLLELLPNGKKFTFHKWISILESLPKKFKHFENLHRSILLLSSAELVPDVLNLMIEKTIDLSLIDLEGLVFKDEFDVLKATQL